MYFVHLNFKQRSNRIIKYSRDQDQLIQNKVLKENPHQPAVCERELKLFSKLFLNVKVMFSPGSPFSRYRRNSFDMRRTNIYNSSKTSSKYFSSIDFFLVLGQAEASAYLSIQSNTSPNIQSSGKEIKEMMYCIVIQIQHHNKDDIS